MSVQRIRRAGIAAVLLAAASVGLSAGSAQALPKDACRDYIHMMEITYNMSTRAWGLYQYYLGVGDNQTASGYREEWNIWSDEFLHWSSKAEQTGC